jgi:hypothetical protein
LSRLNALSNLTRLSIGDIKQDDTGMNISGLTKLEHLTIESAKDSQLRDEDLACLARLSNLGDLQIVGSTRNAIGDQGLAHLAGLNGLWRLSIASPKATDAGLGHLRNLKKLRVLFIEGDFTGEGLRHLEELEALGSVTIRSAHPLSRAARSRLQQALPNCRLQEIQEPAKETRQAKKR